MEQSSAESNSKEGASIVSADKDFLGKKRSKRSSKSKTNSNSSSSKHETSSSGSITGTDSDLTQKHNQLQQNKSNNNTNNNESSTVSVPIQKTENLNKVKETKVAAVSGKPPTENLNKAKETTKVVISSKPVEKPKTTSVVAAPVAAATTPAATTGTAEEASIKQNCNIKNITQQDSPSIPVPEKKTFDKITSPVEVTPEPPANDVKRSVLAMGRLLEPRSNQPIATAPNNPWPKYIREIQRCLNSLDRLNDELNMNCDYGASEISDLFGEMQITLQNREHYLLLELETLRNTASALLAERWDLGTVLKKKVTRMNVFTPDSNRELQQEIQQFIADRKLDKDIANKCRFVANRRDGLHYAKNFGHVESVLPTYTSLIMANSKLKTEDPMLQEMPYSVMEVMPVETPYGETGWVNKQLLPLDLSSYGPYAAIMNPMKDMQVISLDQMMFLQPQVVVQPTPVKTQPASPPKAEPVEPKIDPSEESDKEKEDTEITIEKVYSKLSAEELLVIQNRVRESLLKQGVKLYPPDGMEGNGKSKPLLTSAQREKKRQKRHRYRERKRLERRAERMEQASDSSNSVAETSSTQQSETKVTSSKHKKSHKRDKSKSKGASENEGSKSPPAKETEVVDPQSKVGSPAQVHSRMKTTKLARKQTNPEQGSSNQSNRSSTDTIESLPKSRNSYAENTTSGEEPSAPDDTNMSPACEAMANALNKRKEPSVNNNKDQTKLMPNAKNCNTEDHNSDT